MRIPLANLLVRSPLPRIENLMDEVTGCASRIPALIEDLIDGNQTAVESLAKEISALEGKADDVKNVVRSKMPMRLFLPVDRRDVLKLVSEIDSIADCAEDVGVLLTLRPLTVPEEMKPRLRLYVERVMDTVKESATLVSMMDTLIESGFSGRAAEAALSQAVTLGRTEHDADKHQDQCAKILFDSEDKMSPVELFMWTKVLNKIGDIANHAEKVGDQFRLFVAG